MKRKKRTGEQTVPSPAEAGLEISPLEPAVTADAPSAEAVYGPEAGLAPSEDAGLTVVSDIDTEADSDDQREPVGIAAVSEAAPSHEAVEAPAQETGPSEAGTTITETPSAALTETAIVSATAAVSDPEAMAGPWQEVGQPATGFPDTVPSPAEARDDEALATAAARLKNLEIERAIDRHALVAMGVGVVPIPLLDLFGVAGVQLHLLRELTRLYGLDFQRNKAMRLVTALLGGTASAVSAYPVTMLLRGLPLVGMTLAAGSLSMMSGATTFAVGQVFAWHCAGGGNLGDYDVAKLRDRFLDQFEKGRQWCRERLGKKAAV